MAPDSPLDRTEAGGDLVGLAVQRLFRDAGPRDAGDDRGRRFGGAGTAPAGERNGLPGLGCEAGSAAEGVAREVQAIRPVVVYQVAHHGLGISSNPVLTRMDSPRASVINLR
jgi:hypothetical protein